MIRIELPWVTATLNPNRRNGTHWSWAHAAKSKRAADAHALALQAMRSANGSPAKGAVHLVVTFCPPDKRRRDLDNLFASLKADLDGVALALGIDDSAFEPVILMRGEPQKPGRVILEVGC